MKKLLFILLLFISVNVKAQQDTVFSWYAHPEFFANNHVYTIGYFVESNPARNDVFQLRGNQSFKVFSDTLRLLDQLILPSTIINWNTAHSWGNHSGLYKLTSYVPTWSEILNKPVIFDGDYNSLTNTPILKKQETFAGSTNSNGLYTVTFAEPYVQTPNISVDIVNNIVLNRYYNIVSISTTGFEVHVYDRTVVNVALVGDVLSNSTSNVNGALVHVKIIEQ